MPSLYSMTKIEVRLSTVRNSHHIPQQKTFASRNNACETSVLMLTDLFNPSVLLNGLNPLKRQFIFQCFGNVLSRISRRIPTLESRDHVSAARRMFSGLHIRLANSWYSFCRSSRSDPLKVTCDLKGSPDCVLNLRKPGSWS